MDKVIELLTRFVIAIERVADNLAVIKYQYKNDPEGGSPGPGAQTTGGGNYYQPMVDADDRDGLLALCKERKINVPPRTKTPTLAKMLEKWDSENVEKEPGAGSDTDGQGSGSDPFGEEGENPFGEDDGPEITPEEIMDLLKKVHVAQGVTLVRDILTKHAAGVQKVSDIAKEHFKAVKAAAEAALK